MGKTGRLFIISGPSGVGKSTIVNAILERRPQLRYSISYTTRPCRGSEQDGVDYHFVSEPAFRRMVAAGAMAEWAEVHGHLYGTPALYIEKALEKGQDVLLDIDVAGAEILSSKYPEACLVFLAPPSMEELERRIKGRGTDALAVMDRRLKKAEWEMGQARLYDHLVINDDLDQTLAKLEAIIDQACSVKGPS